MTTARKTCRPTVVGLGCGLAAALLCLCASPASAAVAPKAKAPSTAPSGPGSLSGVWLSGRFNPDRNAQRGGPLATPTEAAAEAVANRPPAMLPWAADILKQRMKDAQDGHPFAFTKSKCLPAGTPQSMFPPAALPIQIIESPGQVTILFEEFNQFRIIHMNRKHAEDPDPGFFGDSVGHWEGDTLVVDTIGINTQTTLGNVGLPHSEALHVVERMRRVNKDTLEVLVALQDPKAFNGVWNMKNTLKYVPGAELQEYFCENDRNTPDETGKTGIQMPGR